MKGILANTTLVLILNLALNQFSLIEVALTATGVVLKQNKSIIN